MELACCQSCGISIQVDVDFGVEIDGSLNKKYCKHCYQAGQFIAFVNMEQMIKMNAESWECVGFNSKEDAVEHMQGLFPKLTRWNKSHILSEM